MTGRQVRIVGYCRECDRDVQSRATIRNGGNASDMKFVECRTCGRRVGCSGKGATAERRPEA